MIQTCSSHQKLDTEGGSENRDTDSANRTISTEIVSDATGDEQKVDNTSILDELKFDTHKDTIEPQKKHSGHGSRNLLDLYYKIIDSVILEDNSKNIMASSKFSCTGTTITTMSSPMTTKPRSRYYSLLSSMLAAGSGVRGPDHMQVPTSRETPLAIAQVSKKEPIATHIAKYHVVKDTISPHHPAEKQTPPWPEPRPLKLEVPAPFSDMRGCLNIEISASPEFVHPGRVTPSIAMEMGHNMPATAPEQSDMPSDAKEKAAVEALVAMASEPLLQVGEPRVAPVSGGGSPGLVTTRGHTVKLSIIRRPPEVSTSAPSSYPQPGPSPSVPPAPPRSGPADPRAAARLPLLTGPPGGLLSLVHPPSAVTPSSVSGSGSSQDARASYSSQDEFTKFKDESHEFDTDANGNRIHKCRICEKVFTIGAAFSAHVASHFKLKNKCTVCGKNFSRSWLLKGHMRTHTGERPYTCPHVGCHKAFADKSNLRSHMLIHRCSDKLFACPKCNRAFAQKRYLHKHKLEVCKI